ncbi:MAG: aminotransferase class I/II-fold pyridoxal phosphate-dependent enzyme [Bacteroidetes bacterium]|nr:aminotransferase class I/II-fold pyridoxal phosphate-dependent enzyme [Bacteroidota bacterium]MBS1972971.1 aminotransferase class I/II-fold pyridoxal phosphate-dependent enzyme [Bacteroidota bacterium]
MKLSALSETLIASEIVSLGGEIREKIRQGEKIYNFTVGDFDPNIFPIPKQLEDEIINAYRNHYTNYPAAEGNLDLRESISFFLSQRENLDYAPNEIIVSCGGRPLIYSVFRAIVDKGDKVIYAVPSWNNNHYTHFNEGRHVVIETHVNNNFMPLAEDIAPHIQDASLICLCSPQNPTGTTISKRELEAICDIILEENSRRGNDEKKLFLMYDQMYCQLTYGNTEHYNPVALKPEMKKYTIFIDAISKVFAATGVRVGWAFGPAKIMDKMKSILGHIGAWAPMAEQKATAKFLLQKEDIDMFLKKFKEAIELRLRTIYDEFIRMKKEGFNVDAVAPQAAIYLAIKIDLAGKRTPEGKLLTSQPEVTAYLLHEAKLAVVPFSAFGASKSSPWYRLSVGTCHLNDIPEMAKKLRSSMAQLS